MIGQVKMKPFAGFKFCSKCHVEKRASEEYFGRNKTTKDGLSYYCKKCVAGINEEKYQENREETIRKQKVYNSHHLADIHRHRVRPGAVDTLTDQDWQDALTYFNGLDAYTGEVPIRLTMDHIVPLKKGGGNERCNILPCNISSNSSKFRADMETWYRKQSFFNEERLSRILNWMNQ